MRADFVLLPEAVNWAAIVTSCYQAVLADDFFSPVAANR